VKELYITFYIGIENTAISAHGQLQYSTTGRKCILVDKIENLNLQIQWWYQKVEWRLTGSHFFTCAV